MTQTLCRWIWGFSETFYIPLGPLAPWVFGKMIGAESWKRDKEGTA